MLKSVITVVSKIKPLELIRLRQVMARGQPPHDRAFYEDIEKFDSVIFLKNKNRICGAATLARFKFKFKNKPAVGIINDHSVLEEKHKILLDQTFYRYLWLQRFKNPWTPLIWFTTHREEIQNNFWNFLKRAGARIVRLSSLEELNRIREVVL